jgi:NAD(P)-dependent dehydrogenase (short-subunit alcohol dehydrogenase family)
MLAAGHAVTAVDRSGFDQAEVIPSDQAAQRLQILQGDALSPDFMESAVGSARERFGRLDALIHLAGTYAYASLSDTDLELWHRLVDTNLTSAFVAARSAASALQASRGLMVFVGAQAGLAAPRNQSAYNASKAALMTFARTLAAELRPQGVRVNCIVPDIIDTPANRNSMPNADTSKWLSVDQVADVLLYLLSDASSGVTGAAIALQAT